MSDCPLVGTLVECFAGSYSYGVVVSDSDLPPVINVNGALSLHSIVMATKEQVSCSLGDESAILSTKNSVYYGLDAVGTRIWKLLQEPRSVREICNTVLDEFEVDPDRCQRDLLELLARMKAEGLIEVTETRGG